LTGNNKKIDLIVLVNRCYTKSMSHKEEISGISQDPVNIMFNPSVISKKDVWQINIVDILMMLIK